MVEVTSITPPPTLRTPAALIVTVPPSVLLGVMVPKAKFDGMGEPPLPILVMLIAPRTVAVAVALTLAAIDSLPKASREAMHTSIEILLFMIIVSL
jgi:hypothetical protein